MRAVLLRYPMRPRTKKECATAAAQCGSRSAFARNFQGHYARAWCKGWLDDICTHMPRIIHPNGYWTKERCAEAASALANRSEFASAERSAYSQACRNGWLNEICAHMERRSGIAQRYIYAIKAQNKMAYVGLTWSVANRIRAHKCSAVAPVRRLFDGQHVIEVLAGPMSPDEAAVAEDAFMIALRADGWLLVNGMKGGNLGSNRRVWTKEKCRTEANKYSSQIEFRMASPSAYRAVWTNGWLEELCEHQGRTVRPVGFWTKEACLDAARLCVSMGEFRQRFPAARNTAQRNGWIAEICVHMPQIKRPNGYWTLERCRESAREFTSRTAWVRGCAAAYDAAKKHGWRDEVCAHMRAPASSYGDKVCT